MTAPDLSPEALAALDAKAAAALPGLSEWKISRYSHGGGRIYEESADRRNLVADTFDEPVREYVFAASPDVVRALIAALQDLRDTYESDMEGERQAHRQTLDALTEARAEVAAFRASEGMLADAVGMEITTRTAAEARLAAVRALHTGAHLCAGEWWTDDPTYRGTIANDGPCATVRAIEGES